MTNKEWFKEEILEFCCAGDVIAVDKNTNAPMACTHGMNCEKCKFMSDRCTPAFAEWCDAEYILPCLFMKDELVEVSDDGVDWRLRHFASIRDDNIFPYSVYDNGLDSKEPVISETKYVYCRKYGTLGGLI